MRFDTVIFDLDGTLLNTLDDITSSVNAALAEFSLGERTGAQVMSYIGSGARALFERAIPGDAHIDECAGAFKAHYREHVNVLTRPYPGVPELILRLKAKGVKIGVSSNKFDKAVRLLMSAHFPGLIDSMAGESETTPKKPSPVGTLRVLSELGGGRALYVGDSRVDVRTAQNASLPGAFVTWGFESEAALAEAGAELLFADASRLGDYILGEAER